MATKNAPFFSRKVNHPEVIRSHRSLEAAKSAAGEMGNVWDTAKEAQHQVNRLSNGEWGLFPSEKWLGVDMKAELLAAGLI